MNKIFNISLHRSGTQSFDQFMHDNRIRSSHWPGADQFAGKQGKAADKLDVDEIWHSLAAFLKKNDAFSDVPFCFTYKQAFAAYPKAKFLIITRDWQGWVASVRKHMKGRPLQNLERFQYHLLSRHRHKMIQDYTDEDLREVYFQHLENAISFFGENRGQLRIFSLHDPALGAGIMDYVTETPKFPSKDYLRAYVPAKPDALKAKTSTTGRGSGAASAQADIKV